MSVLITMIPTLVFLLIILYQMLRGFIRGKRKSIYLLINMAIAMAFTIISYVSFNMTLKGDTLLSYIPGAEEGLSSLLGEQTGYELGDKTADVILAYIQMFSNFILLIILQLIIYPFAKAIAYIVYLVAFRKKVKEDKEDDNMRRVGGLCIGALRGIIIGFLVFSQFSTLYYVVAGGVFYTSDEYEKLDVDFDFTGQYYLNDIYEGVKTSRTTGLEAMFEKLSINGQSLDYLYVDLLAKGTFDNYNDESTSLTFRKEVGNIIGIAARLYETGVVTFDENFKMQVDASLLTPETIEIALEQIMDTNTATQALPTVVIELAVMNAEALGINLTYEDFANLDVENDIDKIGDIFFSLINLVQYDNGLDLDGIDWYGLDDAEVDKIIRSVSEITFLTQVMLPLGVGMLDSATEELVFNLDSIFWDEEIQNLEGLYGMLQDLELSNGFSDLTNDLGEIFLAVPETEAEQEKKDAQIEVFNQIITKIFDSKLVYQVAIGSVEMLILNMGNDDTEYIEKLELDVSDYSHDDLKSDIQILTTVFVDGFSIYQQLSNTDEEETSLFDMDMKLLKKVLLGEDNGEEKYYGIYDLKFINECLNEDAFFSAMFENSLGSEISLPENLHWRSEFEALFDVVTTIQDSDIPIEDLMNGDITALSEMNEETRTDLTNSICDSVIITSLFVSTLTSNDSDLGFLVIPDNIDWYGDDITDGEMKSLLNAIFYIVTMDEVMDDLTNGDMSTIFTKLDEDDLNEILKSKVIVATLSTQFDELAAGNSFLVIPDDARENGYISADEIVNLFNVIQILDIQDLSDININQIQILSDDNIDVMLASKIMSSTLVCEINQLTGSGLGDVVSIPTELSNYNNSVWYGESGELSNLLYGLQAIFGDDATISSMTEVDFDQVIENNDVVFKSAVLTLSISEILLDSGVLIVPTTSMNVVYGSNTINSTELSDLLDCLSSLGITDYENIDVNNLEILTDSNINSIVESSIMSATFVNQLLDLDNLVSVPVELSSYQVSDWYGENGELSNLLYGLQTIFGDDATLDSMSDISLENVFDNKETILDSVILSYTISESLLNTNALSVPTDCYINYYGSEMIKKDELSNLLTTLQILGIEDFDSVSGDVLKSDINYNTVFISEIFRATASDAITNSTKDSFVICGEYVDTEGFIIKSEMIYLFTGLTTLGLNSTEVDDFESLLDDTTKVESALESNILHDTFSKAVLESDLGVPLYYYTIDSSTKIDVVTNTKKTLSNEIIYTISKTEILALINVVNIFDSLESISDVANLGIADIAGLETDDKEVIFSSYTLCTQLSGLVINLPIIGSNATNVVDVYGETSKVDIINQTALKQWFDDYN